MSKIRDQQILALTMQGYNQQQIADKIQCSQATVSRRLKKLLGKIAIENREKVEEMRALSHLECLQVKKILWDTIQARSPIEISVGEIDRLLKIEERIAKLFGLDSPTKIAPVMPGGDEAWQGLSDYDFLQKIIGTGKYELNGGEILETASDNSTDDSSAVV